ncbi:MAG TPA: hypothetical protein ENI94_12690 [Gammaproteobacteria bacterium]|nr:hypothetical protein [Gammaproteobacteria bacterium]
MQQTAGIDSTPWYRQAWPLLLFIPPGGAVIGGILTIMLAIQSPNAMVVDDYYKEGLAINQQKHRLNTAREQRLDALLRSDGKHLLLTLHGNEKAGDGELTLQFIHATRAELDHSVQLKPLGDRKYAAPAPAIPNGVWYLRLRPADKHWEIRTRIQSGEHFQARLSSDELGK